MPPVLPRSIFDASDPSSTFQKSDNKKPDASTSVTLTFLGCPSSATEISMNFASENIGGRSNTKSLSEVCLKNEAEARPSNPNRKNSDYLEASGSHESPCCSHTISKVRDIDKDTPLPSPTEVKQETEHVHEISSDQYESLGTKLCGKMVSKNLDFYYTTETINEIKSDDEKRRKHYLPDSPGKLTQVERREMGSEDGKAQLSPQPGLDNTSMDIGDSEIITELESTKGKRKKSSRKLKKIVDSTEGLRSISPSRSACRYIENPSPITDVPRKKTSIERGSDGKASILSPQRIRPELSFHKNKSDGRYMDNPDGSTGCIISTEPGEIVTGSKFHSDQAQRPKAQGDAESMKKANAVRNISPMKSKRASSPKKSKKESTKFCLINEDDLENIEDGMKIKGRAQSVETVRTTRFRSKPACQVYPSLDEMFNDVMKLLVQQSASQNDINLPPLYDEDGRYILPETLPLPSHQNTCQSAHLCCCCDDEEDVYKIPRSSKHSNAGYVSKRLNFKSPRDVPRGSSPSTRDDPNFYKNCENFCSTTGSVITDNNLNCHHCFDDDMEESCQSWAFIDPEPSSGESSRQSFGSNEDINTAGEAGPQLRENGTERPCVRDMIKTFQDRLTASSEKTATTPSERNDESVLISKDSNWTGENTLRNEQPSLGEHGMENNVLSTPEIRNFNIQETQKTQPDTQNRGAKQSRDIEEDLNKVINTEKRKEDIQPILQSESRGNEDGPPESVINEKRNKYIQNLKTDVTICVTPASPIPAVTCTTITTNSESVTDSTDDSDSETATHLHVPEVISFPMAKHPDLILMEQREMEMVENYRKMSENFKVKDWALNTLASPDDAENCAKVRNEAKLNQGIVASCFARAKDAITRARARSVSPTKAFARLDDLFGKGKSMAYRIVKSWSVSDFNQIKEFACYNDSETVDSGDVEGRSNEEDTLNDSSERSGIHEFMSETSVTSGDAHPPFFCLRINESVGRKQSSQLSRLDPLRRARASSVREGKEQQINHLARSFTDPERRHVVEDQLPRHSLNLGRPPDSCLKISEEYNNETISGQSKEVHMSTSDNEVEEYLNQRTSSGSTARSNEMDVTSYLSNSVTQLRSPILAPIEETDSNAETSHHPSDGDGLEEPSEDALDAIVACGMSCLETVESIFVDEGREQFSGPQVDSNGEEETDDRACKVHACASCTMCKRDVEDVSLHDDVSSSAPIKTFSLVNAGEAAHTESGVSDVMALISQEVSIKRYPSFPDLTDLNDDEDPILAEKESAAAMQSIPDLETDVLAPDQNERGSRLQTTISNNPTGSNESSGNISYLREESPRKSVAREDCGELPPLNHTKLCRKSFGTHVGSIVSLLESRTATTSFDHEAASCHRAKSLPQTLLASGLVPFAARQCGHSEASDSGKCHSDLSTHSTITDTVYQIRGHDNGDIDLPSPPNHSLSEESRASESKDSEKDSYSSLNDDLELAKESALKDQTTSGNNAKTRMHFHQNKIKLLKAAVAQDYNLLTEETSTAQGTTITSGPCSLEEKLLVEESDLSLLSLLPDSSQAPEKDDSDASAPQNNADDLKSKKITPDIDGAHSNHLKDTVCDKEDYATSITGASDGCGPTAGEHFLSQESVSELSTRNSIDQPEQKIEYSRSAGSEKIPSIDLVTATNTTHDTKEVHLRRDNTFDIDFDTKLLEFHPAIQKPRDIKNPSLDPGKEEMTCQSQNLGGKMEGEADPNRGDNVDVIYQCSDHSFSDKCNSCLLLDESKKQRSTLSSCSVSTTKSSKYGGKPSKGNVVSETKVSETLEKCQKDRGVKAIKLTKRKPNINNRNNNLSLTFSEVTCARTKGRGVDTIGSCQSGYRPFRRASYSLNEVGKDKTVDLGSMADDTSYTITTASKIIGLPHQDNCKRADPAKRLTLDRRSLASSLDVVSEVDFDKSNSGHSRKTCSGTFTVSEKLNDVAKTTSSTDRHQVGTESEISSLSEYELCPQQSSRDSVVSPNDLGSDSVTEILTPDSSNLDVTWSDMETVAERRLDSRIIKHQKPLAHTSLFSLHSRPSISEEVIGNQDGVLKGARSKLSFSKVKHMAEEPTKLLSQRIHKSDPGTGKTYSFVSRSQSHIHKCDQIIEKSYKTISVTQSIISKTKKQIEDNVKVMRRSNNGKLPTESKDS